MPRNPMRPARLIIAPPGIQGAGWGRTGRDACRFALAAVVETVNFTCAGWPSAGVTDCGLKAQKALLGRAPQVKLTALLNPPAGVTVRVKVADWPGVIVAVDGEAAIEKLGGTTVILTTGDTLPRLFRSPA